MADRMKLHEAIVFATKAHEGQKRKETDIDYISHPMEVAQILTEITVGYEESRDVIIIAGVLHDVLEENENITKDDIEERFGSEVAELVSLHTHPKKGDWMERKMKALDDIKNAYNYKLEDVVFADKLANLRSIYYDYLAVGDKVWERFNAPKEQQCIYYNTFLDMFASFETSESSREAYWEATAIFKDLFVQFYVDEKTGIIWQVRPEVGTYVCTRQYPFWEDTEDEPNANARPVARLEAEAIEDGWKRDLGIPNDFYVCLQSDHKGGTHRAFSVTFRKGKLEFEVWDCGSAVEDFWGDDEYEEWFKFDFENMVRFFNSLGDDPVRAIEEKFSGGSGPTRLREYCEEHDINFNNSFWV